MSQNKDVGMGECDEDESLAFARKLQADYAFASYSGSANDEFRLSTPLSHDYQSDAPTLSALPSKGKEPMTDEEYARQLAEEMNDHHSRSISDHEFALLLQMQEDPDFDFSSMFPPTPKSHSSNDNKTNDPFFPSQKNPPPPSPPVSPPQTRNPFFQNTSSYVAPTADDGNLPPPLLQRPKTPEGWTEPERNIFDEWRNSDGIGEPTRLDRQLSQAQHTSPLHSATVHPQRS
jgi:hypothetical protein